MEAGIDVMKNQVIRYISTERVEFYRLDGGELTYIRSTNATDASLKKYDKVILSKENYAEATLDKAAHDFNPDKEQFLFSSYSTLDITDLLCLPAQALPSEGGFHQVWASRQKLLEIKELIPKAQKFYPETYFLINPIFDKENLNGSEFKFQKLYFTPTSARRGTKVLPTFLFFCLFFGIAPWLLSHFLNNTQSKLYFQNQMEVLERFTRMTQSLKLPTVNSLNINNSLQTVTIQLARPIGETFSKDLDAYCSLDLCQITVEQDKIIFSTLSDVKK